MKDNPIQVKFFRLDSGREPVRDWLNSLDRCEKKIIGKDIKKVQFEWPVGMPLVRSLDKGLWEIRSYLQGGRTARILITFYEGHMIILDGFIKKKNKLSKTRLGISKARMSRLRKN